jgi:hypothetical protein
MVSRMTFTTSLSSPTTNTPWNFHGVFVVVWLLLNEIGFLLLG